jgi:histidine triad (HIT) family protein
VSNDIYCDEILSGRLPVRKVMETDRVLAFHHTRPFYPVHIMVIPNKHILSLIHIEEQDIDILHEILDVVRQVASQVTTEHGACGVSTYMGDYQTSKHMHWHVVFGEELKER